MLFALSAAGIVFVVLSRSVTATRIVLPLTPLSFSVAVFIVFLRYHILIGVPRFVIAAALAANAVFSWWMFGYCPTCGRTTARGAEARCPMCAKASER
ncbi:MAG: hypothetical protein ACREND_12330 [Gemmatimonadaceae bacterium]